MWAATAAPGPGGAVAATRPHTVSWLSRGAVLQVEVGGSDAMWAQAQAQVQVQAQAQGQAHARAQAWLHLMSPPDLLPQHLHLYQLLAPGLEGRAKVCRGVWGRVGLRCAGVGGVRGTVGSPSAVCRMGRVWARPLHVGWVGCDHAWEATEVLSLHSLYACRRLSRPASPRRRFAYKDYPRPQCPAPGLMPCIISIICGRHVLIVHVTMCVWCVGAYGCTCVTMCGWCVGAYGCTCVTMCGWCVGAYGCTCMTMCDNV